MFNFFKRKSAPIGNYADLGIDFHSHLLPGIDDGSPDVETSWNLIEAMRGLGFKKIITTPHVLTDLYPNSRDLILSKRDELMAYFREKGVELNNFDVAAEYFLDETFVERMNKEPLLTLPGNRVLVEMSFFQPYPDLHRVMFDLQMKGYRPVLAHPERYRYYTTEEQFAAIKQMGCEFQVNILSLTGYYSPAVQAAARTLLRHDLIDFLSSDLHHAKHVENLQQALAHKSVAEALACNTLKNKELLQ